MLKVETVMNLVGYALYGLTAVVLTVMAFLPLAALVAGMMGYGR